MAVQTFSCPECDHLLRSSNPIAAGKKVRCPRCQAVFPAPGEKPVASTAVKKAAATGAGRSAQVDDDLDGAPGKRRREEAVAPPRKLNRVARDEDDDDVDEEEEEREERPRKKKKKKKASSAMPLLLGFGGGAVLVAIFVVLAFVAPGFLLSKPDTKGPGPNPVAPGPAGPEGPDNVLAYAPAESAVLAGVNVTRLRSRPDFAQSIQQMRLLLTMQGMPGGLADVAMEADQVLFAVPSTGRFVVSVSTTNPYNAENMKRIFQAQDAQPIQGRQTFRFDDITLAVANKRVLIFSNLPEPELGKVLTTTQVNLDKEVQQQIGKMQKALLWALVLNKGHVQQGLQQAPLAELQKMAAGLEKLIPYVQKARSCFATLDMPENKTLDLNVGLACADTKDAQAVVGQVQDLWGRHVRKKIGEARLGLAFLKGFEPVGELLTDVERSFKVSQQGAEVTASVQVSEKTIKSLEQLPQNFGGAGFNPGFNPGGVPNRGGAGPPGPGAPPFPPRKRPSRS